MACPHQVDRTAISAVLIGLACFGCSGSGDQSDDASGVDAAAVSSPADSQSQPSQPPAQHPAFPDWAFEELSQLTGGVTPESWRSTHQDDSVDTFDHLSGTDFGRWCARMARDDSVLDGRVAQRWAYFYLPPTLDDLTVPPLADSTELAFRECELGVIWVQTAEPDDSTGVQLVEQVTGRLSAVLEEDTSDFNTPLGWVRWFGSAFWSGVKRLRRGDETVVAAYDSAPFRDPRFRRVLAYGYLPISGVGRDFGLYWDSEQATQRWRESTLARATQSQGMEPAIVAAIDSIVAASEDWERRRNRDGTAPYLDSTPLVTLLTNLTNSFDSSNSSQATNVLAADLVLSGAIGPFGVWDMDTVVSGSLRDTLDALGATFWRNEIAASYEYNHSWLNVARSLDPGGVAGTMASVLSFESSCNGADVIAEGEKLLEEELEEDSVEARVHYLVASAHRDIVVLAGGGLAEYIDPAEYVDRAPEARLNAIAHYREALTGNLDAALASEGWQEAWRLAANIPPLHTRFICIYD